MSSPIAVLKAVYRSAIAALTYSDGDEVTPSVDQYGHLRVAVVSDVAGGPWSEYTTAATYREQVAIVKATAGVLRDFMVNLKTDGSAGYLQLHDAASATALTSATRRFSFGPIVPGDTKVIDTGAFTLAAGIKLAWSSTEDAYTAGAMSAVVPSGTAPPVVTLTGTPVQVDQIRIEVFAVGTGALGNTTIRWSKNGGVTWEATGVVTADPVVLTGSGLTAHFGAGPYSADNVWTAQGPDKLEWHARKA